MEFYEQVQDQSQDEIDQQRRDSECRGGANSEGKHH